MNFREIEIELGRGETGFGHGYRRRGLVAQGLMLDHFELGGAALLERRRNACQLHLGEFQFRLAGFENSGFGIHCRLVGTRIDFVQQIALIDDDPILKSHVEEMTGHTRSNFYVEDGIGRSGKIQPVGHGPGQRFRDRHFGWWRSRDFRLFHAAPWAE